TCLRRTPPRKPSGGRLVTVLVDAVDVKYRTGIEFQRLAHQLGERSRAHFLHYPGAMDLDRPFGNPQLESNLLVQAPRDDMAQYLLLAPGQGIEVAADALQLTAHRSLVCVARQRALHRNDEATRLQRLCQEVDGAGLHGPHA